ncbi:hypothetical protein PoB_006284600 [Plakobranchus ocellatus]|uniref:Uncharacterized protein n=1 Tax=Plakobranchus ocellatus TaxID=259542 RepID=A0AAV4CWR4_9GAST|nr:hypothetical protein PoB_006284600 [Plakobranchus ocellatus]
MESKLSLKPVGALRRCFALSSAPSETEAKRLRSVKKIEREVGFDTWNFECTLLCIYRDEFIYKLSYLFYVTYLLIRCKIQLQNNQVGSRAEVGIG